MILGPSMVIKRNGFVRQHWEKNKDFFSWWGIAPVGSIFIWFHADALWPQVASRVSIMWRRGQELVAQSLSKGRESSPHKGTELTVAHVYYALEAYRWTPHGTSAGWNECRYFKIYTECKVVPTKTLWDWMFPHPEQCISAVHTYISSWNAHYIPATEIAVIGRNR